MSDQPSVRTRTPCVGMCSTTYGDDGCRGCKRFIHEVINWNSFKPEEKEAVWKRLEHLKTLIMESKVIINNENLMESKILEFQLKINKDLNPLSKVFEIVKLTITSFKDLKDFGVDHNKDGRLISLKEELESELYELSKAHFDRYFVEPIEKLNKN